MKNSAPVYRNPLTRALARWPFVYRAVRGSYFLVTQPRRTLKGWYRRLWRTGIFVEESELAACSLLPEAVLDEIIARFHPASVLDVGAGTGQSLAYFISHGIEAVGIEGSALAIAHAAHPERMVRANLDAPINLGRRFDLVWSYEVVEHVHPRYVDALVTTLTAHADRLVMSAAQPGQGGEGHLNEQPPEYWIEQLRARRFLLDAESTRVLQHLPDEFSANLLVFYRNP